MEKKWSYIVNPFMSVGLHNFKKAVKISGYTDSMLGASTDAFYIAQYAIYHPLHQALYAAYTAWKMQGGTQRGSSVLLYTLLHQLSSVKADQWDAQVRAVYAKTSPEYAILFPQYKKPFQSGSVDSRIVAVNVLGGNLTPYGGLAATKADVDTFYGTISAARSAQESQIGGTNVDSHAVTLAVTDAMNGMFTFLNSALANFPNDTDSVADMFDLRTIRHHEQTFFTGHVNPLAINTVCKRTFHQDIQIQIENMSNWAITVYSSDVKGAAPGGTSVSVPAFHTMLVSLSDLGDYTTNHYIQVYNPNAFVQAGYHINLDPDAMEQAA